MSKFNLRNVTKTVNKSGHTAYRMNDKDRLLTGVLTSLYSEKKFYGDNSKEIIETVKRVIGEDAKFIANLCIYARKEMYLRSISHVLVGELAREVAGKQYVRKVLNKIIERPDDMSEILAYYINTYGKPIPNALKKGIADSITGFDEYQLAKYNRMGLIKLKDLLCLTHPRAKTPEQNDVFKRVLEGKLKTPITWETELSKKGNNKEVWERLIDEKRLGYMAMMRNLRNIIKCDVSNMDRIYDVLTDENRVLKNKQLPFRYYSAYKALKNEGIGTSKIFDALETAIEISTKNIEKLEGRTFISADVSGSMNSRISGRSDTSCAEIAVLMMAIANHICEESITTTFDTGLYMSQLSTRNGIIANANSIRVNGGGTDISLPIRYLLKNKIFVDRIIILSDNEINSGFVGVCQELVESYKRKVNSKVWVHAVDMMGYGTQQFMGDRINLIAGWNEKVLDFINKSEQGIDNLRSKVEEYYFK